MKNNRKSEQCHCIMTLANQIRPLCFSRLPRKRYSLQTRHPREKLFEARRIFRRTDLALISWHSLRLSSECRRNVNFVVKGSRGQEAYTILNGVVCTRYELDDTKYISELCLRLFRYFFSTESLYGVGLGITFCSQNEYTYLRRRQAVLK